MIVFMPTIIWYNSLTFNLFRHTFSGIEELLICLSVWGDFYFLTSSNMSKDWAQDMENQWETGSIRATEATVH